MVTRSDAASSTASDTAIERLLDQGRARTTGEPEQARLWETVASAAEGGKRFRPVLVSAAHDALGGTAREAAVAVGAAVELLHTAFVIHDDVIDGDDQRRGRPNVSGTYRARAARAGAAPDDARAFGSAAGILAGDLALAAAIRAVATCGARPEVTERLLDLFDATLHTAAAGELVDVRLSLDVAVASLPESLSMEEQKTGSYSFSLPLQAGALLAGADDRTVRRLGEVGRLTGIAFQLLDDLLGVFGDPAATGKSTTSDLRTRKQTPLLSHARTTAEWALIDPFVGRDLDDDELLEVRRLLTACGSRDFVEELIEAHAAGARAVVEELGLPGDLLDAVTAGAALLRGRDGVAA